MRFNNRQKFRFSSTFIYSLVLGFSGTFTVVWWQYALLERIQREEEREEHENRHTGRYRRVFPPVDRMTRIRYANLLANAYRIFLSGRQTQSLDLEIQRLYSCDLKVEIL